MRRLAAGVMGLAAVSVAIGCGGSSSTGAAKQAPTVEKEIKGGKGKTATDELPPPPVRQ